MAKKSGYLAAILKGFHCPTCQTPLGVTKTQRTCSQRVRRYRRCVKCSTNYRTKEVLDMPADDAK